MAYDPQIKLNKMIAVVVSPCKNGAFSGDIRLLRMNASLTVEAPQPPERRIVREPRKTLQRYSTD